MTTNLLQRLVHPSRVRSVLDDVLVWSPLPLLLAVAAWRWQGTAAAALVALAGLLSLAAFAWWRARRFDQAWLVRQLDARRVDMEDSTDLLFAADADLNPLQQLQRARLQERLRAGNAPDLRPVWSTSRIAATWIAGAIGIVALLYWPSPQATATRLAPSAEDSPIVEESGDKNQFFGGVMGSYER